MIRNNKDLRAMCFMVHALGGDCADFVRNAKREIRAYYKETAHKDRKIINETDYGSYVLLIELPEFVKTMEDACEYFDEYERLTYVPSQYDCTGQLFTNWYKPVKRNGRWYVYHSISMDV